MEMNPKLFRMLYPTGSYLTPADAVSLGDTVDWKKIALDVLTIHYQAKFAVLVREARADYQEKVKPFQDELDVKLAGPIPPTGFWGKVWYWLFRANPQGEYLHDLKMAEIAIYHNRCYPFNEEYQATLAAGFAILYREQGDPAKHIITNS